MMQNVPLPQSVDKLDIVFGRVRGLLPDWDVIPEEFKNDRTKWNKVANEWFFIGLKDAKWMPKKGIEADAALSHVMACLRSWEPKHEHKIAGVSYLLSLWFDKVSYAGGPFEEPNP